MTAKPRTLAQMQDRRTAYEVAMGDVVIGYTARKTKQALLQMASENGQMILDQLTPEQLDTDWTYSKKTGLVLGGVLVVNFTGRTEREAAQELARAA